MIDLAALSLGEWFVCILLLGIIAGFVWVVASYDLIDPRGAPDFSQAWRALRYGEPIHSQWKPTTKENTSGYILLIVLSAAAAVVLVCRDWIISFVNQL